ncbi:MAG: oligosaccharide flippase family protein, partial [Bradymonadaceae bacterium]
MATAPNSSARKLASGSLWTTVSEVFSGLATLATSLIAARVLAPEDFGHMAIIYLTIAMLEAFSQTGFERALVQRQGDVDSLLNVAWSWQLGRGALIALLMAMSAPFMASFYN